MSSTPSAKEPQEAKTSPAEAPGRLDEVLTIRAPVNPKPLKPETINSKPLGRASIPEEDPASSTLPGFDFPPLGGLAKQETNMWDVICICIETDNSKRTKRYKHEDKDETT